MYEQPEQPDQKKSEQLEPEQSDQKKQLDKKKTKTTRTRKIMLVRTRVQPALRKKKNVLCFKEEEECALQKSNRKKHTACGVLIKVNNKIYEQKIMGKNANLHV